MNTNKNKNASHLTHEIKKNNEDIAETEMKAIKTQKKKKQKEKKKKNK
ncbi:hypothetical protein JP0148_04770 [Helicobacter pylori]